MAKKEYTFLVEDAALAKGAADLIRSAGKMNMVKGAVAGAGIGALGGVATNAMKRDDDPTKTRSSVKAAIGGAVAGMGTGAVLGSAAGHLARSGMARNMQNNLIDNAEKALRQKFDQNQFRRFLHATNGDANAAMAMFDANKGSLDAMFNASIRKGTENAGTLTRFGWGMNPYKTLDIV